jgi:hypothetical protein
MSDYQLFHTKCCFLVCYQDLVYTTDFGLGCFYSTCLRTKTTKSVYAKTTDKYLYGIMGATVDPVGNILVSVGPCDKFQEATSCIEVFSNNGIYRRRLDIDSPRPVGIVLDGRNFYLADVTLKTVEVFALKQKSNSAFKKSLQQN